jgi:hypothetical protein
MIFGFSTSFGSSERFSFGGSGAAGSSFFALAGFFAGFAAGSAAGVAGASEGGAAGLQPQAPP